MQDIGAGASASAASLLFALGHRPAIEDIRALADHDSGFTVSFDPQGEDLPIAEGAQTVHWLELLSNGLTFDLEGLAPGEPRAAPVRAHAYALAPASLTQPLEAITLKPGPHIAAGGRMLPVLRGMAFLAARLVSLPGVQAVAWHAARTWSGPQHFQNSVMRWIEGEAFPGLGLTALAPTPEGGLQSEGLALFTGQELRIAPELAVDRAAGAKLALRLIHWLVENGSLQAPVELASPEGRPLVLEPSTNGRFVGVWRG